MQREATCSKCGALFETTAGRVCADCRRPRGFRVPVQFGDTLTPRESSVVLLVGRGLLNKEIAFELRLTEGTVKEYLNRIFKKLRVRNRAQLAVWSFQHLNAA